MPNELVTVRTPVDSRISRSSGTGSKAMRRMCNGGNSGAWVMTSKLPAQDELLDQLVDPWWVLEPRQVRDAVQHSDVGTGDGLRHRGRLGHRERGVFRAGDHQHRRL